jgi:hypothetical protein
MLAYFDDVYLPGPPVNVTAAITAAPPLYKKVLGYVLVGVRLCLNLYNRRTSTLRRSHYRVGKMALCCVILSMGLKRALASLDTVTCASTLSPGPCGSPAARHDRLLRLARDIAEDAPLTAPRLLQVRGVNRFGHVISTTPPAIIHPFAEARDAAVVHCLETIQEHEVSYSSTHALPAGARGASLHSLVHHG